MADLPQKYQFSDLNQNFKRAATSLPINSKLSLKKNPSTTFFQSNRNHAFEEKYKSKSPLLISRKHHRQPSQTKLVISKETRKVNFIDKHPRLKIFLDDKLKLQKKLIQKFHIRAISESDQKEKFKIIYSDRFIVNWKK